MMPSIFLLFTLLFGGVAQNEKGHAVAGMGIGALHRQNKRLVRWVSKGEWLVGFEACEQCGLYNNRLQCFDYSDSKPYLRLLFHPSTSLFADTVPKCKVIRSDMDEHQDQLSMVVTETFYSLQSEHCTDHFDTENVVELPGISDSHSLIQTVCSPRAVEVVVPRTVVAISCGGQTPLSIEFLSKKQVAYSHFALKEDINSINGVTCTVPGLDAVSISNYYLPVSCKFREMTDHRDTQFFQNGGKKFKKILRVACDASDLRSVSLTVDPNDDFSITELNDVVVPYSESFYLAQVYPFRWDVSSVVSLSVSEVWESFEISENQLGAAIEINTGCGCSPRTSGDSDAAREEERRLFAGSQQNNLVPHSNSRILASADKKLLDRKKSSTSTIDTSREVDPVSGGVENSLIILEKKLSADYAALLARTKAVEDDGSLISFGYRGLFDNQCRMNPKYFNAATTSYSLKCRSPGSAYVSFSSWHDILVNGQIWHPRNVNPAGYWELPVETFTLLPAQIILQTLEHEPSDGGVLDECSSHEDCDNESVCVEQKGTCRKVLKTVHVDIAHASRTKMDEAPQSGSLKAMQVNGPCSLEPAFDPTIFSYVAMCTGGGHVSVEGIIDGGADVLANGMTLHKYTRKVSVPAILYLGVPSAIKIETLEPANTAQAFPCKGQEDCPQMGEFERRCVVETGTCRTVRAGYTISLFGESSEDPENTKHVGIAVRLPGTDSALSLVGETVPGLKDITKGAVPNGRQAMEPICYDCLPCAMTSKTMHSSQAKVVEDCRDACVSITTCQFIAWSYRGGCWMFQKCDLPDIEMTTDDAIWELFAKKDAKWDMLENYEQGQFLGHKGEMPDERRDEIEARLPKTPEGHPIVGGVGEPGKETGVITPGMPPGTSSQQDLEKGITRITPHAGTPEFVADGGGGASSTARSIIKLANTHHNVMNMMISPSILESHVTESTMIAQVDPIPEPAPSLKFPVSPLGLVQTIAASGAQKCIGHMKEHKVEKDEDRGIDYILECAPTVQAGTVFISGPGLSSENMHCAEECEPVEDFQVPQDLIPHGVEIERPHQKVEEDDGMPTIVTEPVYMKGGRPLQRTMSLTVKLDDAPKVALPRKKTALQVKALAKENAKKRLLGEKDSKKKPKAPVKFRRVCKFKCRGRKQTIYFHVERKKDAAAYNKQMVESGLAGQMCSDPRLREIYGEAYGFDGKIIPNGCQKVPGQFDPEGTTNIFRFICQANVARVKYFPTTIDGSARIVVDGNPLVKVEHHVSKRYGAGLVYPSWLAFDETLKKGEVEGTVKSEVVSTICGFEGNDYHVVIQKGTGLKPEMAPLKAVTVEEGEGCSVSKSMFSLTSIRWNIDCPESTKWVSVSPVVADHGLIMTMNGLEYEAGEPTAPIRLKHGETHYFNFILSAPTNPDTGSVIPGYRVGQTNSYQIAVARNSPWGLGDAMTDAIANTVALVGIGLTIMSGANFLTVAKFLQFLGLLMAVHGVPEAFKNFCSSFSKVNFDFSDIMHDFCGENFLSVFDDKKFTMLAATETGLPQEIAQKTEEIGDINGAETEHSMSWFQSFTAAIGLSGSSAARKEAADAAAPSREQLKQIAKYQRRYKKQFIAFKENIRKFQEDFQKQKGLIVSIFLIPLGLFCLASFYVLRSVGRYFFPSMIRGCDWDQVQVHQTRPNFLLILVLDLCLIGFVRSALDVYFKGEGVDLTLPLGPFGDVRIHPSQHHLEIYVLTVLIAYPVTFLVYTLHHLARFQHNIKFNQALGQYVDAEECQEIRATEVAALNFPLVGPILKKIGLTFHRDITSVSPILEVRNRQGELVFDKLVSTLRVEEFGITLAGYKYTEEQNRQWRKVVVTEVDPHGGIDISTPIFMEGERLVSLNEVPVVQLKLKEIANIMCAGCDGIVVANPKRGVLKTPHVMYGFIRDLTKARKAVMYPLVHVIKPMLSSGKLKAAAQLTEERDKDLPMAGGSDSAEFVSFLVSSSPNLKGLPFKHFSQDPQLSSGQRAKLNQAGNLIHISNTEFNVIVASAGETDPRTHKFTSQSLPRATKHNKVDQHGIDVEKHDVMTVDMSDGKNLRDIGPGVQAVDDPTAMRILKRSDPLFSSDQRKNKKGFMANPVSYDMEVNLTQDCRVDVRLYGRSERHYTGFKRDSLSDQFGWKEKSPSSREARTITQHHNLTQRIYYETAKVTRARGAPAALQKTITKEGTNKPVAAWEGDTVRMDVDFKDCEEPLVPLTGKAVLEKQFQRRLGVLEIPKLVSVVANQERKKKLFNHVRELRIRGKGDCSHGTTSLTVAVRSTNMLCHFGVTLNCADIRRLEMLSNYAQQFQSKFKSVMKDRFSQADGQNRHSAGGVLIDTTIPKIPDTKSITVSTWEVRKAEKGQGGYNFVIEGYVKIEDVDANKLVNKNGNNVQKDVDALLNQDRTVVLQKYRKACAKFNTKLWKYLDSEDFVSDLNSCFGLSFASGNVNLSQTPYLSDVKEILENVVTLGPTANAFSIAIDYGTSTFLRKAAALDRIELWWTGPSIAGLTAKCALEEAVVAADSDAFVEANAVKVTLASKVFVGAGSLHVNLDSTGLYKDNSLRNRAVDYLVTDEVQAPPPINTTKAEYEQRAFAGSHRAEIWEDDGTCSNYSIKKEQCREDLNGLWEMSQSSLIDLQDKDQWKRDCSENLLNRHDIRESYISNYEENDYDEGRTIGYEMSTSNTNATRRKAGQEYEMVNMAPDHYTEGDHAMMAAQTKDVRLEMEKKVLSSRDAATKAIDDRVQLHPGVSPHGYLYRLSSVFDKHPTAKVGETTMRINTVGDHKFKLPATVELRHIPTLHWYCPNYVLTVPKKHLVCPRVEAHEHYYSGQADKQRYSFMMSRLITLFSIYFVIFMGAVHKTGTTYIDKAKEAVHDFGDKGAKHIKDAIKHSVGSDDLEQHMIYGLPPDMPSSMGEAQYRRTLVAQDCPEEEDESSVEKLRQLAQINLGDEFVHERIESRVLLRDELIHAMVYEELPEPQGMEKRMIVKKVKPVTEESKIEEARRQFANMSTRQKSELKKMIVQRANNEAGYKQIVALGVGAISTLVFLILNQLRSAFNEKESVRIAEWMEEDEDAAEDLDDEEEDMSNFGAIAGNVSNNVQKTRGGIKRLVGWYARKENRYWWWDCCKHGEAFIYSAELILVLILCLGHPGAGNLQILPDRLTPYLLIFVATYTVYTVNRPFILEKAFWVQNRIVNWREHLNSGKLFLIEEFNQGIGMVMNIPNRIQRTVTYIYFGVQDRLLLWKEQIRPSKSDLVLDDDEAFERGAAGAELRLADANQGNWATEEDIEKAESLATGSPKQTPREGDHNASDNWSLPELGRDFRSTPKSQVAAKAADGAQASDAVLHIVGAQKHGLKDVHDKVKTTACCHPDHSRNELENHRKQITDYVSQTKTLQTRWAKGLSHCEKLPPLKASLSADVDQNVHLFTNMTLHQKKPNVRSFVSSYQTMVQQSKMKSIDYFHVKEDCMIETVNVIIPRIGLWLPARMEPLNHTCHLRKKLLTVKGMKLKTNRELIHTLPLTMEYEQFAGHKDLVDSYAKIMQNQSQDEKSATRKEQRILADAKKEYLETLNHGTRLDRKQAMATLQVVNMESLSCSAEQHDSYLTLYRSSEDTAYTDVLNHLHGRADAGPEHHAAETLAYWFMQIFEWFTSMGADLHSLSGCHAMFNQLFWAYDPAKNCNATDRVKDISLLSKFLRMSHHPLASNNVMFLYLIYGEELSEGSFVEKLLEESNQIEKVKRKLRTAASVILAEDLEHEVIKEMESNRFVSQKERDEIRDKTDAELNKRWNNSTEFVAKYRKDNKENDCESFKTEAFKKFYDKVKNSIVPHRFPGFLRIIRDPKPDKMGELVKLILQATTNPTVLHVVMRDTDIKLEKTEQWKPNPTELHSVEMFRLDATGHAVGTLGLLQMTNDRLRFERALLGRACRGPLTFISFDEIVSMKAVIKDFTLRGKKVNGRTLYVLHRDASVTAFVMSEPKIRMYSQLIQAYGMETPQHQIFGYLGSTTHSPLLRGVHLRHGVRGLQRWFANVNTEAFRMERGWYDGGWQYHRYHGIGRLYRTEYSQKEVEPDMFRPVNYWLDIAAKDPINGVKQCQDLAFQRNVLVYDGDWSKGKRHGKGSFVFRRFNQWYRFFGLFIENEPIFGEIEKLDLREGIPGMHVVRPDPAKDAAEKETADVTMRYYLGNVSPLNANDLQFLHNFHWVNAFELYCALALWVYRDQKLPDGKPPPSPAAVYAYCVDAYVSEGRIHANNKLRQQLNSGPVEHARASGYNVEDLSEFDLWCLQRLGENLLQMPLIAACRNVSDARKKLIMFHSFAAFEVPQSIPLDKENFSNVSDEMRGWSTKCWHQWFKTDVPLEQECVPQYVQVSKSDRSILNGVYQLQGNKYVKVHQEQCQIWYEDNTWHLGEPKLDGKSTYMVKPAPLGSWDAENMMPIHPPSVGWNVGTDGKSSGKSIPHVQPKLETAAYAPAFCVDQNPATQKDNALKALEALPASATLQQLRRAMFFAKKAGCDIQAVRNAANKGKAEAHWEDVGGAFAENAEMGRNFFGSLQKKYEAINARHDGAQAMLAQEVQHVIIREQAIHQATHDNEKTYRLFDGNVHREVPESQFLSSDIKEEQFLKLQGSNQFLQESLTDEDSLMMYHCDDDHWNYDRSFVIFNNKHAMRGSIMFMNGEKMDFIEGGVPDAGFVRVSFRHLKQSFSYEGNLQGTKFHGYGALKAESWSYEGNWKEGMRHGVGKLKCKPSAKFGIVSYEGGWYNNRKEGHGRLVVDDEREVTAMWKADKPVEIIKFTHDSTDDAYDFSVEEDESGKLNLIFSFDDDMVSMPIGASDCCGDDIYTLEGDVSFTGQVNSYTGKFLDGKFAGSKCTQKWGTYEGGYKDGLRHAGEASIHFDDFEVNGKPWKGTRINGEFKNDKPFGKTQVDVPTRGKLIVDVEADGFWKPFGGGGLACCCGDQTLLKDFPKEFFQKIPPSVGVGYDGKFPFNWSEMKNKRDWPTPIPQGLPGVVDKLNEGNESLLSEKPVLAAHRNDAAAVKANPGVMHVF